MSRSERIVIGLTALGVLFTGASFALYVHHEQAHGEITMSVTAEVLLFIFVASCGLSGWAVYRNLKDAHRAKDLEAQIATVRDDHKGEIERLNRGHNAAIAHKDSFVLDASAEARKAKNDLVQQATQHQSELDDLRQGWELRTGELQKHHYEKLAALESAIRLSPLQVEAFQCAKKLRDWIASITPLFTPPLIAGEREEEWKVRVERTHAAYRARVQFEYERDHRDAVTNIYREFAAENIRDLYMEQWLERVQHNEQVLNMADSLETLAIRQFAPAAAQLLQRQLRPLIETIEL